MNRLPFLLAVVAGFVLAAGNDQALAPTGPAAEPLFEGPHVVSVLHYQTGEDTFYRSTHFADPQRRDLVATPELSVAEWTDRVCGHPDRRQALLQFDALAAPANPNLQAPAGRVAEVSSELLDLAVARVDEDCGVEG